MSLNPNAITLTEGEQVAYTITVKRAGAAVDISTATSTIWVHDDEAAFGTNKVAGSPVSFVTDGTDGRVTYTFTSANTGFASDREFRGVWALKVVTGSIVEWTKQEPLLIARNPFIVEG